MKRAVLWIVATTFLLGIVLLAQHQRTREVPEASLADRGYFEFESPRALEPVRLLDGKGRPTQLARPGDDWTLVFFGFTACPDVCPTTLSILNLALENESEPPRVVMVTVDPARDTPARLQRYVRSFNPGFAGLSGSIADIRRLTEQLHIRFEKVAMDESSGNYTVEHSGAIVVLDPAGRHAGYIRPPLRVDNIRTIARSLAKRSQAGAAD